MKKTVIKRLLLAAVIFICAFLASCGMKDPYHIHAFGDWRIMSEATCTKNGLRERVCKCGEKETEKIPSLKGVESGDDNNILFWAVTPAVSAARWALFS